MLIRQFGHVSDWRQAAKPLAVVRYRLAFGPFLLQRLRQFNSRRRYRDHHTVRVIAYQEFLAPRFQHGFFPAKHEQLPPVLLRLQGTEHRAVGAGVTGHQLPACAQNLFRGIERV